MYSEQTWTGGLKIEWCEPYQPHQHRDLGSAVRCADGRYARLLAVGDTLDSVIVTGLDVGDAERLQLPLADTAIVGHIVCCGHDGIYKRV